MAKLAGILGEVERLATEFASQYLDAYVVEITRSRRSPSRKEVNDPLWGTIGLTAAEVVLLDSPLLQRLRYIRQLGVVHWVYPGAGHTRFEHTLGVIYQVQHLVSALNADAASQLPGSPPLIDNGMLQLLRLSAILHDVGHAAFSHVSEMAIESVPDVSPIGAAFSAVTRVEQRQLSEIFAYYIVRSPAMQALFELLLDRSQLHIQLDSDRSRNLTAIIEKISDAIIGKKIDDRLPLLHELISGPFDADKLDYFVRDAKLAGTPSLVDISRLVQKLTVRFLDGSELPRDISTNVNRIEGKYCLFGLKWSGVAVIDELLLARVLLFAKIYRHPKVAAIEQMLRAVVLTMTHIAAPSAVIKCLYEHCDDALLNMTSAALASALNVDYSNLESDAKHRLEYAVRTLRAVRDRRLWVRGFQIHRRYPADPLEGNEAHRDALIQFLEDVEHPQKRNDFMGVLLDEVHRILSLLDATQGPSRLELESLVMLHTLGPTPGGTKIARAYLLPSSGRPLPFREYTVNRSAWADSYLSDQPKGFIFADAKIADAVFLAVEKLLRMRYQVRLPQSARETSKRDAASLEQVKRQLEHAGYYKGVPFDIRPTPDRLLKADIPQVLDDFERVRSMYLEPRAPELAGDLAPAGPERTHAWLRQFGDDQNIDCALRLLSKFKMLTRANTVAAVEAFVTQNPEFRGACVVPFGSAKDSGAVQTYFTADLLGSLIHSCLTLEEAARREDGRPLIFIDDFVGSGGQASDILGAGFGQVGLRVDSLNEQRTIFEDDVQAYLRRAKIGFVFTAAWDSGIAAVENAACDLKLDSRVYRHIGEDAIPFAEDALEGVEPQIVEAFMNRCQEIGESLLISQLEQDGRSHDSTALKRVGQRALGYGNRAMLLASPFNVPTQTLTAIWARGRVGGVDWIPLFARRKKL
ncbi:phosphoribosyltransferase-like protein [Ramlibacter sp. AN1133]|uniref:phosphoribosyltransferase-like protein n=1 Tax=Ramlibacter sp. AN1133 TaxID=3133429 RepID=UPI0030BC460F